MKYIQILFVSILLVGCASTAAQDLPEYSNQTKRIVLQDGDTIDLVADEVEMKVKDTPSKMLAYNGTIPGPVITVKQGSTINLNFINNLEVDSSLHSHGLRLRNKYDGVPGVTQDEVKPGETFRYELDFPDAGVYFYHPHTREDVQQDAGLYGAFLVLPSENESNEFGVNLQENHQIIFLDDIEVSYKNQIIRQESKPYKTLMGNYGNRMFINGKLDSPVNLQPSNLNSEQILTFVNSANARPYKLKSSSGIQMTLLSDDASAYQNEEFIQELVVAPSERYTVRLKYIQEGPQQIFSETPNNSFPIAKVDVLGQSLGSTNTEPTNFTGLQIDQSLVSQFQTMPISKTLSLDMLMDTKSMRSGGMWEMPCHQMPDGSWMGDCDESLLENLSADHHPDGIEWEDGMRDMNSKSGLHNVWWDLVDKDTGLTNMDIEWNFQKDEVVKIRIENKADSAHPMQHPIHLHGQRFLVLSKDNQPQTNLAWNDTVLVPAGSTYDIVVEMSNPGTWMIHCHIPEHMEAGMMMTFEVQEN